MVEGLGTGFSGTRHVDQEGVERVFKGYAEKTYETVVGPVTVRSAMYYKKEAEPSVLYPLRERQEDGPCGLRGDPALRAGLRGPGLVVDGAHGG